MAVYTELTAEALHPFLASYRIGHLRSFHGIAEGVENSNFLLRTTEGDFILTLFERRVNEAELPWFLGFMRHLHQQGLVCPLPVADESGDALKRLAGRPAAITTFLSGVPVTGGTPALCRELGVTLARLHEAGRSYAPVRRNALSVQSWGPLLASCDPGEESDIAALKAESGAALEKIARSWPGEDSLPRGQIHADLFPDNVFFQQERISGLIDFYFACTDFLAYDLAICLNAWCFPEEGAYAPELAQALLSGYQSIRPLRVEERTALPILCQGAALRFLLTRLYDWINISADALVTRKSPWAYQRRLSHFLETGDV